MGAKLTWPMTSKSLRDQREQHLLECNIRNETTWKKKTTETAQPIAPDKRRDSSRAAVEEKKRAARVDLPGG